MFNIKYGNLTTIKKISKISGGFKTDSIMGILVDMMIWEWPIFFSPLPGFHVGGNMP